MSSPSSSASEGTAAKRVAIVQSAYIPWKGFFDLANSVDELILLEDAQYTRRDWRNRNRIKTPRGLRWLTIPVKSKGRYLQRIDEVEVSDQGWRGDHWRTLVHSYSRAPCFERYRERLEELYLGSAEDRLSAINRRFIEAVLDLLGIRTRISLSTDYGEGGRRSARLVSLCRESGATKYLSGPTARSYLDKDLFAGAGIGVDYMDYSGYPEYPQLHPPFEHKVSIIDLLVHTGPEAPRYMKSFAAAAIAHAH
jgi:WbqC-like protein family